jgi:peroxiredoxin
MPGQTTQRIAQSMFLAASLVAISAPAWAQDAAPAAAPKQAPPKLPAHEAKLSDEAKAIIDRATAAYLSAKTYQDRTHVSLFFGLKADNGDKTEMPSSKDFRFAYGGPRAFAYRGEMAAAFAKDTTVTCAFYQFDRKTKKWTDGEKEVVKIPAEGPLDCADNLGSMAATMPPTPVQSLYMSGPGTRLDLFLEAGEVSHESLDGQEGAWVGGKGICPYTPGGSNGGRDVTPMRAWFSAKTGMLERIVYDISRTSWALGAAETFGEHHGGGGSVTSANATVNINSIVVGAPIDDKEFIYAPGGREELTPPTPAAEAGKPRGSMPAMRMGGGGGGMTPAAKIGGKPADKKAAEGETVDSPGETTKAKMLDKPAPAFKAKTPDDKDIALADFKGKVVLLDVWATWCGPCMQAIPAVQRVSEHFKDQPVAVIGINRDKPSDDVGTKVRKALDRKAITFFQAMDQSGEIAKSLGVSALPTMFILDKEGVVRYVHVGSGPDEEAMLTTAIDKVLKGEKPADHANPDK